MHRRNRARRRRRGFTLMELLLVMAILVVLASLVGVSVIALQKSSNINATKTQIGMFGEALDAYRIDIGSYPSPEQGGLEALVTAPQGLKNPKKWRERYLKKDIPADPWGNDYQYELKQDGTYHIWSWGPDGNNGTEDDISSDDK